MIYATPTPSIESRLASFVRSIATSCRGCPRRKTADCIHSCSGYGAEALIRELDEQKKAKSIRPASATSKQKYGAIERRRKILAAMPEGVPLASRQIEHPDGAEATNKTKDLQDMCRRGMLTRTRAEGGNWRYMKPCTPQPEQ